MSSIAQGLIGLMIAGEGLYLIYFSLYVLDRFEEIEKRNGRRTFILRRDPSYQNSPTGVNRPETATREGSENET